MTGEILIPPAVNGGADAAAWAVPAAPCLWEDTMNIGTRSGSAPGARRLLPALAGLAVVICAALAMAPAAMAAPTAGSPWQVQPLPAGVTSVTAIACPTASSCMATGSAEQTDTSGRPVILLTADGGQHWAEAAGVPDGLGSVRAVTCATAARCWVAGSWTTAPAPAAAVLATDGGLTWTRQVLPPGLRALTGIGCVTSARCWAVGRSSAPDAAVVATDDGGATWAAQTLPAGIATLSAVSCTSTTRCWAAGTTSTGIVVATADGGRTWTRYDLPGTLALDGISCLGDGLCRTSGLATVTPSSAALQATDDGGQSWSAQAVPPGLARLWAINCPSDQNCQAVGQTPAQLGAAIGTTDGGATWVTEPLPASVLMLSGVACAGTADCWAVGTARGRTGVILHQAA